MSAVYAIGADTGAIKIGVAGDVRKRLRYLQTGHPDQLKLHYAVRVQDAPLVERSVHARLAARRSRGEWFDAELSDVIAAIDAEIDARGLIGQLIPIEQPGEVEPPKVSCALRGLDNALAKYLIEHRIRPAHFAEQMGLTKSYLHFLLTGKRGMSLALAGRIVRETEGEVTFEGLLAMHATAAAWRAQGEATP